MSWKKIERDSNMWNFEEKKELEGTYLSKELNQGPKKNSTIHKFEVGGEEVTCWGSTVLDGKLESVEKHYGFDSKIKIVYNGKLKGKTGTEYKDYDVEAWVGDDTVKRDGSPIEDKDIPVVNVEDEDNKVDLSKIPF